MLLIGGAGIFSSCQKQSMSPVAGSDNISVVSDEAKIDNESAVIDDIANLVAFNSLSSVRGIIDQLPACATVTYDTAGPVKTATIDFGTTPCLSDWDQKYREGILVITWNGDMKDVGTVKTVTTQNYFVGAVQEALNKFDFTKTITNMGLNENGNYHFSIVVSNAVMTFPDSTTVTWTANYDREWTQGFNTVDPNDNVFLITGSSSGTDKLGQPFSTEILTPLMKDACAWIVSGVKAITHGNNPTRVIDYGDGSCDDIAVVTVNGANGSNSYIIHLK